MLLLFQLRIFFLTLYFLYYFSALENFLLHKIFYTLCRFRKPSRTMLLLHLRKLSSKPNFVFMSIPTYKIFFGTAFCILLLRIRNFYPTPNFLYCSPDFENFLQQQILCMFILTQKIFSGTRFLILLCQLNFVCLSHLKNCFSTSNFVYYVLFDKKFSPSCTRLFRLKKFFPKPKLLFFFPSWKIFSRPDQFFSLVLLCT